MKRVQAEFQVGHGGQIVILDINLGAPEDRWAQGLAGQAAHANPATSEEA